MSDLVEDGDRDLARKGRAIATRDELDRDLRDLVSYSIKRANAALMGDIERVLGRFGLRRSTYSALSVVTDNPGVRQSDVSQALAIERPNMVQILDELQRSGLIVRVRDPGDRRAYLLSATTAGTALMAEAGAALHAHDQRLTEGFSAEQRRALIAALRRVEGNGVLLVGGGAWEGRNVGKVSTP